MKQLEDLQEKEVKDAKLPNIKWHLGADVNKEDADKMGISLIDVDNNNTLLCIDTSELPYGFSVQEFIEWIEKEGIVVKEKKQ